jgi:iron complex transport system substrate-binding protein
MTGMRFILLLCSLAAAPLVAAPQRVVTAGGTVTEIVYALGQGSRVVGADVSSVYPAEAQSRPSVGYVRQLSAEGVLSLAPEVLITTADAGPPAVLEQIKAAGVRVEVVPAGNDWEAAKARIRFVAGVLGVSDRAKELEARLDASKARVDQNRQKRSSPPRVLFIYARGAGTVAVSGTGTEADAIIALAGGSNAVTAYQGYRPFTAEALAAAKPDLILLTSRGLESLGGTKGLAALPGLSEAVKTAKVESMDDLLLLGFGPRLGEAVETLEARLPGR